MRQNLIAEYSQADTTVSLTTNGEVLVSSADRVILSAIAKRDRTITVREAVTGATFILEDGTESPMLDGSSGIYVTKDSKESEVLLTVKEYTFVGYREGDRGAYSRIAHINAAGDGLVHPVTGQPISLGSASKLVSADGVGVSCASGVSTAQGLSATGLLDTHSLVDTVNGTILIPSDATHMSVGIRSTPTWGAGGIYRQVDVELEVVTGVWVSFGAKITYDGLTAGPQSGALMELQPVSVNGGKKMRFSAKQNSGGALTPANLGFYAQFMIL